METQTGAADPILRLVEAAGGIDPRDRFMFQMVSPTDVVKNDMKKVLKWDETTITQRLQTLIRSTTTVVIAFAPARRATAPGSSARCTTPRPSACSPNGCASTARFTST